MNEAEAPPDFRVSRRRTMVTGMIKLDEKVGGSRKYARYLPFWA
jgi:hypothetical protein